MKEFDLIEQVFRPLAGEEDAVLCGIGDDAAILALPQDCVLAVSTDTLVAGVHFFPDAEPFDIGFKSLAVNLSDLAAMAAQPRWATLSLTLPETEKEWLVSFARGFGDMARKYDINVVGGDISRGPLSITCQIMGTVRRNKAVSRGGARPGDAVYVSGKLGLAALALRLLGPEGHNNISVVPAACVERLRRPLPRVELGMALSGTASAMIDLSDGLNGDLRHILNASGAGAEVQLGNLPVSEDRGGFSREEAVRIAAAGGDDYELCFTVPGGKETLLDEIAERVNCPLTRIGRIVDGSGIRWLDAAGNEVSLNVDSYRHF